MDGAPRGTVWGICKPSAMGTKPVADSDPTLGNVWRGELIGDVTLVLFPFCAIAPSALFFNFLDFAPLVHA